MPFIAENLVKDKVAQAQADLDSSVEQERPDEFQANKDRPNTEVEVPNAPSPDGHNWKERYANLQKYIDKTLKPKFQGQIDTLAGQVNDLTERLNSAVRTAAPAELPQSISEIEELRKESPGAYTAIVTLATQIAEGIVDKRTKGLEKEFDTVRQERKRNQEESAFIQLQKLHPDLDLRSLETDEVFMEWLGGKSKRMQDALLGQKEDVDAASEVLTLYKLEMGIKKQPEQRKKDTTQQRREAARNVDTNFAFEPPAPDRGYDFTESQIDEMDKVDSHWFEKNADAIDKAMKTGRVLRDLTDPAGAQRRLAARAA